MLAHCSRDLNHLNACEFKLTTVVCMQKKKRPGRPKRSRPTSRDCVGDSASMTGESAVAEEEPGYINSDGEEEEAGAEGAEGAEAGASENDEEIGTAAHLSGMCAQPL